MPVYRVLNLVRQMGLEPTRSRTRPSNVPVCRFQHCRIYNGTKRSPRENCQPLSYFDREKYYIILKWLCQPKHKNSRRYSM